MSTVLRVITASIFHDLSTLMCACMLSATALYGKWRKWRSVNIGKSHVWNDSAIGFRVGFGLRIRHRGAVLCQGQDQSLGPGSRWGIGVPTYSSDLTRASPIALTTNGCSGNFLQISACSSRCDAPMHPCNRHAHIPSTLSATHRPTVASPSTRDTTK